MGVVDEAAAAAVKKGVELFTYSIADSMIDLNGNGTVANREETPGLIIGMISFTVDPFSLDFVRDWWGTSLIFFVMIALIYICAGGGFALLSTIYPDTALRMSWIVGDNRHFEIKEWISNISLALVFPFLTYFGLYIILQLCYVITALLATTTLDAIPPLTSDNIVVYIFMAITYLVLSIIMGIRNIVIVIFCAGGLMLATLYLIPVLRSLIINIFMYFLLLVFMQPLMVFVAAVGIMFIASLPPVLITFKPALLIALMVLLLIIGIVLVFGYETISLIMRIGTRGIV